MPTPTDWASTVTILVGLVLAAVLLQLIFEGRDHR